MKKEELEKIRYINPAAHSHFSMPLGIGTPKDLILQADALKHDGIAITDMTSMAAVLPALKQVGELKQKGKISKDFAYLIGCQFNIIDDLSKKDRSNKYFSIRAIAKNFKGYQNLNKLISLASLDDHFYVKPRISLEEIIEYSEGLIITSGDMNGLISQAVVKETGQEDMLAQIFQEYFKDDFYLEVLYHPMYHTWDKNKKDYEIGEEDLQKKVNLKLFELARRYNIKCVLSQNTFINKPEDYIQQKILIGNHPSYSKDGWFMFHSTHLQSVEEMYNYIQKHSPYISDEDFKEWCENTIEIKEKTKGLNLLFRPELPLINYDENEVNKDEKLEEKYQAIKKEVGKINPYVQELFEVGDESDKAIKTSLKIMIKNNKIDWKNQEQMDRLAIEMKVIGRNGIINLCDYFLLIEDVSNFIVKNEFQKGPGRGSGAGSITTYALDITDVDPLRYGLLFERFLTAERIGSYNFEVPGFPLKKP